MLEVTSDKVFFTSDTHFGHKNIIEYSKRPYKTAEEMDEALIANWNAVVPKDGIVFHLGDVGLCSSDKLKTILDRLNGTIYLIKGNHEKSAMAIKERFVLVRDVMSVRVVPDNQEIFMSHYAHRVWNRSHHKVWHLYGHSHGTLEDLATSLSFDVGVDCTDYKPLSYQEVRERMLQKTWKPLDHHQ